MIKHVFFDVDGVLLDSLEASTKFFQDLMIYGGYTPPTKEEYAGLFHLGLVDVAKLLLQSQVGEYQFYFIFHASEKWHWRFEHVLAPG